MLAVEGGVAGDRVMSMLEVPEGDCAVAIARATPSVDDGDLFAYGEDGAVLGSDEGSDKSPALLVCPPHPRRILLVARIAAGHGLVAIGAERVALRDAPRAASVYGVRYQPGELAKRMSVWPGLDEKVEEHRRRVGGRWVDVRRVAVPLDARTPTRVSASIDAERCLDVLIAPSDEVTAVDVVVQGEDGRVLGRAQSEGRDRTLIVCSPTPVSISLELRPHLGIGLAVVMLSRSEEGSEPDIDAEALRLDVYSFGSVAEERKQHDALQASLGYPPARVVASGTLPLGRRLSYPLDLPEGCVRLDWVSGAPLRGVEAFLYAPDGALLAKETGKNPGLFRCGPASAARLDAGSLSRAGPFALELYPERGTPKLLEKYPLAASRLLGRMLETGIIASARQVGAVYASDLTSTALTRQALTLPFGRCLDVTLAIGPGAATSSFGSCGPTARSSASAAAKTRRACTSARSTPPPAAPPSSPPRCASSRARPRDCSRLGSSIRAHQRRHLVIECRGRGQIHDVPGVRYDDERRARQHGCELTRRLLGALVVGARHDGDREVVGCERAAELDHVRQHRERAPQDIDQSVRRVLEQALADELGAAGIETRASTPHESRARRVESVALDRFRKAERPGRALGSGTGQ